MVLFSSFLNSIYSLVSCQMNQKRYLFYISQNYSFAILRPIQAAILRRGGIVKWFIKGDEVNTSYFAVDEDWFNNIYQAIDYNPDVVFVPGNLVPKFIPGLKVGVFHGFNAEKRSDAKGHFNIRGWFDMYCTQGPNTTAPFKALAHKHQFFTVKETGWPAVDNLFKYTPVKNEKPVVLLCSTFSKKLSCAPHLFEQVNQLSRNGKWQWIVQFHPKMDVKVVEQYKSIQHQDLQFVETDNVLPLLQKADVMVCDTSSVLLMFLLLSKPVVTFKNSNPKPYLINFEQPELLAQMISHALTKPKQLMDNIEDFQRQTHPYKDGLSAERVLNAVEERLTGSEQPKKRKPLNIFKSLAMRWELNYWHFN